MENVRWDSPGSEVRKSEDKIAKNALCGFVPLWLNESGVGGLTSEDKL